MNDLALTDHAVNELPLISICIPVLNEAENLDALYQRLNDLGKKMLDRCRLEFIFTDNHSSDNTWQKLALIAASDKRVRAIRFSKNFGFQRSILANYLHVSGDAVLQIDADLQDPPELLESFFDLWRQGYGVVYGVRRRRKEGVLMNVLRRIGYWVIDKLSEYPIPRDAGDFRLVDRKIIEVLKKLKSSNPYLRGQIAGMGFRQIGVPYARELRRAGKSKFRIAQLLGLGLTGVLNHSFVPLRLASYAGSILLAVSFFGAIYYIGLKIFNPELPQGLASVHILILFGIGFQSLLLGILGEYLLRIYIILRNEPVAISEDVLNFCENDLKL